MFLTLHIFLLLSKQWFHEKQRQSLVSQRVECIYHQAVVPEGAIKKKHVLGISFFNLNLTY